MLDNDEQSEYTYKHLVEPKEFLDGPEYKGSISTYIEFKVGPNPNAPDDEFCIEDSIGRFIPLRWEHIGELVVLLDSLQLKFNKDDKENKENEEDL